MVVTTAKMAYDVLSQNVYGSATNGITKLYAQLLAAKLNIKSGADPSEVASIITSADNFLATKSYSDWTSLSNSDVNKVSSWHTALDSYNNGMSGPGHCESQEIVPCIDIMKKISVDGGKSWLDADTEATAATKSSSGTVQYKLVVNNCGSVDLANIDIDDAALGINNYIIPFLSAGGTSTITSAQLSKLTVTGQCATAGSFVNIATAKAMYGDVAVSASDSAWLVCNNTNVCIDTTKDISIDGGVTWKSADTQATAPVTTAPHAANYRIIVKNCGSSSLSNVEISDPLLGITAYSVGTLSSGASKTYTSKQIPQLKDPDACATAGTFLNLATVSGMYNGKIVSESDGAWLVCTGTSNGGCSYTQGYWKTHTTYDGIKKRNTTWDKIGENTMFFNTGQSWYEVLMSDPSEGNAYYILAHQYIAAYLNKLSGVDTSAVDAQLKQTAELLDMYDGNPKKMSDVNGSIRTDFINTASVLDQYNNGTIGPGHCK